MAFLFIFMVLSIALLKPLAAFVHYDNNAPINFIVSEKENIDDEVCWIPELPNISHGNSMIYENIKEILGQASYQKKSIARFQGAIRVDTQTNDDFGSVSDDPRWFKFYQFSAFLAREFPLVHSTLQLKKINRHGLLFIWETTSSHTAKPFLLMAHQDTVPVSNKSLPDWQFDPFEGRVDENGIMFGRGVHDDKNSLISILEGVELLLENGFRPKRTVILAFGFDEEVSGRRGALEISKYLEQQYGQNSLEFILDEGPGIIEPSSSSEHAYATVATAEKGYLDVLIEAKAPGGHSSLAGKHSLIGIMAEIIVSLENVDPFLPRVSKNNPLLEFLSCQTFEDREVPALLHRIYNGDIEAEYELGLRFQNSSLSALVQTSQAIDLISGGQKINALPETVSAGINYRIRPDMSLEDVKRRIVAILEPIAKIYNLTSSFFEPEEDFCSARMLRVSQIGNALEPAKMSPRHSKGYAVVFGTVRSVLGPVYSKSLNVTSLRVVPTLMAGNTDTRHYWNLTENLFRFRPTRIDARNNGGHTVNEHIHVSDHFASVQFYTFLILNASEM